MSVFLPAFPEDELQANKSRAIDLDGNNVLICKASGALYALENRCSHQNAELTGGRIRGCFIACPVHGVRFNLQTGEPMGQLTGAPIKTYPVRVLDGIVQVNVS